MVLLAVQVLAQALQCAAQVALQLGGVGRIQAEVLTDLPQNGQLLGVLTKTWGKHRKLQMSLDKVATPERDSHFRPYQDEID